MSADGSGRRYCALGFGSNFFYPLGSEALRVPAGLLSSSASAASGGVADDGGRNRENDEGESDGDVPQHDDADHGHICLLAINPRGSSVQVPSPDDDGSDQEQAPASRRGSSSSAGDGPPSSDAAGWLASRLIPPETSSQPGGGHTRYSSSELPSASCGVTHTSYVIPKPGSGTGWGEAHLVGTMFGRTHRKLALQPTRLPLRIARVASGRRHVIALTEGASSGGGVVMSWGAGHFGQLGHGPELTSCPEPRIIERLLPHNAGGEVVEIAAGGLHSAAIVASSSGTRNGRRGDGVGGEITVRETRTFAWGSNRKGQCGIEGGKCATVPEPTPVIVVKRGEADGGRGSRTTEPVDRNVHFEKLAMGRLHTVALTAYGEVFTWGSTSMGRCGHTSAEAGRSSDRRFVQQPRHVSALRNVVVEAVAAGAGHTMALSRGGRVFAWGAGGDGQCGQGHAGNLFSPRPVEGLPSAGNPAPAARKRASAGGDANANGSGGMPHINSKVALEVTLEEESLVKQLSQGARITQTNIEEGEVPSRSDRVVAIRASGCYSAALSADGDVYTWGYAGGVAVGHEVPPPADLPLIPLIEGNQYSTSTAAKVYPAGRSAENKARDAKCFDTSLNVMLPRRVEATDALGLRVEEVALGPGHMVLLCSRRCDSPGPPGGYGSPDDPDDCHDDGGCDEAGIEVGHLSDTAQTEAVTDSTHSTVEETASLAGGTAAQDGSITRVGTDGSITRVGTDGSMTRSYSQANSTGTGSTNDSPDELTCSHASSAAAAPVEPPSSAPRSGNSNAAATGEKKRRTTKGAAGGLLSKLKSTGSRSRRSSAGSASSGGGGAAAGSNGGGAEGAGGGGGKRKSSSAIGKMIVGMAKRDGS